jgi:DNA topoisomerase VI subunit B
MSTDPLVLRFGGSLVEQLGAQLYPSVTATVAELVSNAWDADAQNVWITIPFESDWTESSEIIVLDDGNGMTRQLAQETYLIVGRKRRLTDLGAQSEGGRNVHGRKGIGKLAAFGTAGILDCSTIRDNERTDFRMDYDHIRALSPADDYEVEDLPDPPNLTTPEGVSLEHGTLIRLTALRMKKRTSEAQFLRSMSRRFALNSTEMKIHLNTNSTLSRFEIKTEFRFPEDGSPSDDVEVIEGWAHEEVNGHPISWWIGFTEKPLDEDQQQGISVLANGKMAQRPFKFERTQGTEGQLGQEYLVGEVIADWLDDGLDIDDDLIQSNRDQLQLEDERLTSFLEWGRRRLAWALRRRAELRREKAIEEFEAGPEVDALLEPFTSGGRPVDSRGIDENSRQCTI